MLRDHLAAQWTPQPPEPAGAERGHVFVGPSGSGKTTCLGKWLSKTVLLEEKRARVIRLDGTRANTAEGLSILGEALGISVERKWNWARPGMNGVERVFVDVPGVDWQDPDAVTALQALLPAATGVRVHLVLNAAYETSLLFDQVRAFSTLPVDDLILTHLDEDPRRGKIWNFILGTKHALSYLGAGQNVPGEFDPATLERVMPVGFA
jgi:flagellar biosynthesis protein FlhF